MTSTTEPVRSISSTVVADKNGPESPRRVPYPGTEGAPTVSPHDMSHMIQIDTMIADLQAISARWGNTCVYIRRGGVSWGAVALNRRDDDKEHGLFDLQAQHDRDMLRRLEQVQWLIEDRDREREARWKCEAAGATTPPESNTSATSAQAGIGSLEGRVTAPKEEVCK